MPAIQPLGQIFDGLSGPSRVDVDLDGNLYVANVRGKNIVKFDKYGTRVAVFADVAVSGLGLAVAPDGSAIYASAGNRVVALGAGGALQSEFGGFQNAGPIALGLNGELVASDTLTRQVRVFPAGGGSFLLSGVNFGGISDIAVDPVSGCIYVADPIFEGIQPPQLYVFYSNYTFKTKLDAGTAFGSRLQFFGGLAFDDANRLYVGDSEFGNIRVLSLPSALQGAFDDVGNVSRPSSMAYDALTKRLFVIWLGSRVDIYGVDGGETPANVNTPPTVPLPVTFGEVASANPGLLFTNATDEDGDTLTYNVQVFDESDSLVTAFTVDQAAEGVSETLATVNVALTENASYTWQVQADDGRTTSAWSAAKTFAVNAVEEAPVAPVLNVFLAGETAGIDAELSWSASTDVDPNAALGYRVEIYDGAAQVAGGQFVDTQATVLGLSETLTPGKTYGWKVVAVDNTGLETASLDTGSFVFQISVLKVSANVPGAKVYLTGHHGYAGRLLGEAPVEIRALAGGDYAVVVEAAGFEPCVTTATIVKDQPTEVAAKMQGASLAAKFDTHALNLAGQIVQGAGVAPIVADLNHDGVLDLLLANQGWLEFYAGSLVQDPLASDTIEYLDAAQADPSIYRVVFADAAQRLGLPQITGAAPCLVDWNNDDLLDLVVGGADGSVKLFRGQGGTDFAAIGEWLGSVSGQALPAVADLDSDGDKDLIVATGTELSLFDNVGSDALPELNGSALLASLAAPAVPLFADWNAEGKRELLLLSQGELFQALTSNGAVTELVSTGLSVDSATSVFVLNVPVSDHKDLLFGTTSGALVMANGLQGPFAPAYVQAVLAQLAESERLVALEAPEYLDKVAAIAKQVERENYASAKEKIGLLVLLLDTAADSAQSSAALATLAELL